MTQDIKRLLLWLLAGLIIIGSIILIMFSAGKPLPEPATDGPTQDKLLTEPVTSDDWTRGAATGKVALVEYSDFQCPACGQWEPDLEKLIEEFGSDLTFVYRHFPLKSIHANAEAAALASEAAGLQGKFWEMHDELFAKQKVWSLLKSDDLKTALNAYASNIGLDLEKFKKDLDSDEVQDAVDEDEAGAKRMKLQSTPTFFLDGKQVNPRSDTELRNMILESLK